MLFLLCIADELACKKLLFIVALPADFAKASMEKLDQNAAWL